MRMDTQIPRENETALTDGFLRIIHPFMRLVRQVF